MISVEDALAEVLTRAAVLRPRPTSLADALGCVLAEDVAADIDLPPFPKALVDGYAVRSADLKGGTTRLTVGEEIVAGMTPTRPLAGREAAAVMTGAPLPDGADAVVMVEQTRREGEHVVIQDRDVAPGRNWLPRGREMRAGELVLKALQPLNPPRLGLLASVGRETIEVFPRPKVAVVTTGDELVEPGRVPGPGQIRNSNATLLAALAASASADVESLPNAPDEIDALRLALGRGLGADVLLVTGGVSAGNRDLVPAALESLGVERVFHKVRLKPGKPLWFGVGPGRAGGRRGALVFGLPGNPVSGLVGFLLFVRPAIRALAALGHGPSVLIPGRLARPFRHRGDRPTYHPAVRRPGPAPGEVVLDLLDWAGSADLRAVAMADGFAAFAAGDRDYSADEIVGFLPLG